MSLALVSCSRARFLETADGATSPEPQPPSTARRARRSGGHALISLLKEAADVSKENVERAMTVAHRLSLELRTAEIGSGNWRARSSALGKVLNLLGI